jgi:P-type conjugative transfer protein TrbJ
MRKSGKVLTRMSVIFLALLSLNNSAFAGTVAGTGGSTEVTQIMNNVQLVNAYQKQIQQFVTQGQQYAAQLKNMEKNPSSVMPGDTTTLINNISRTMAAGQSMGGSMAQIDRNFAARYNNPTAASYSQSYTTWTNSSKDTLHGAMQTAGMRRDQYASDTAALSALYDESQSSGGTVSAIQTLSKINMKSIEQMQGLGELMATQNIASSTYMASQASQGQASVDNNQAIQDGLNAEKPSAPMQLDTSTKTYKKSNLYSK